MSRLYNGMSSIRITDTMKAIVSDRKNLITLKVLKFGWEQKIGVDLVILTNLST